MSTTTVNFVVGTLKNANFSTGLIMQDVSASMECDTAETKDENGNVAYVQYYNHRAVLTCNAAAAKDAAQPTVGATVSIKGIVLPSPSADGSMTSATITLPSDASTGTAVDFLVTSATLSSSNSDVCKYALTLTRYLENGIGAIKTSTTVTE